MFLLYEDKPYSVNKKGISSKGAKINLLSLLTGVHCAMLTINFSTFFSDKQ